MSILYKLQIPVDALEGLLVGDASGTLPLPLHGAEMFPDRRIQTKVCHALLAILTVAKQSVGVWV